jgi:hypothetical protein
MRVGARGGVRVHVGVADRAVGVDVDVERAAPPAPQQLHPEHGDGQPDRRLDELLHPVGQPQLEEHDRQPEGQQREAVADTPGGPEPPRDASIALVAPGDEGRHRHEVVGVGRVPQAQDERDGERAREAPRRRHRRAKEWTNH